MTTLIINKGKNKAKVWIQDLLIGGIITDENGNDTVVSKMFFEGYNLEEFFNKVTKKTGIDFFPQKQQTQISA
jgi:hypothetical protein